MVKTLSKTIEDKQDIDIDDHDEDNGSGPIGAQESTLAQDLVSSRLSPPAARARVMALHTYSNINPLQPSYKSSHLSLLECPSVMSRGLSLFPAKSSERASERDQHLRQRHHFPQTESVLWGQTGRLLSRFSRESSRVLLTSHATLPSPTLPFALRRA